MSSLAKRITVIYQELFGDSVSFRLSSVEKKVYSTFIQEFKGDGSKFIYQKENRWRIVWSVLGEMASEAQLIDEDILTLMSFSKQKKTINVHADVFFCYLVCMKRELGHEVEGLPNWLIKENVKRFYGEVKHCTTKPEAIKSILKGRKKALPLVKNQADAIKMVKGKLEMSKIIDLCKQNNPGKVDKKYYTEEYMKDLAQDLYDVVGSQLSMNKKLSYHETNALVKKYRISRKKSLKYIAYWYLMSGIQSYHGREIQICTKKEKAYFGYAYKLFRDALVAMKKIQCVDATFCPGIRSRTFKTEIFKPKSLKFSKDNSLSVTKFEDFMLHSKKEDLKPFQLQYLKERFAAIHHTIEYKKQIKKISYIKFKAWGLKKTAKDFAEDHPMNVEAERMLRLYEQRIWGVARMSTYEPKFLRKYSEPKSFDFDIINGIAPKPEYALVGRKLVVVA
ncbi:MAG TPA: hypothetical protein PKI14_05035 [Fervidobacterium sp.]|nr:hypothetical protein [Fervidobacterium sp.]